MRPRLAPLLAVAAALALPATAQAATKLLSVGIEGTGAGTVVSSPAGIDCGTECSHFFGEGETVTLTGSPAPDSAAVRWSGCDTVSEGKCEVTISGARSVSASFDLNQLALKVTKAGSGTGTVSSSPAGINGCATTCSHEFGEGSAVTLTGSPGPSSQPAQWSGCDSVTAEDRCVVRMSAAREVSAAFNLEGPLLTLAKAGTGAGTVRSEPAGVECGPACAVNFLQGAKVTLLATPSSESLPVLWSGCDAVAAGKCEVSMTKPRTVTATFDLKSEFLKFALGVEKLGNGQGTVNSTPAGIECGTLCETPVRNGHQIVLTATPAQGSVFEHWSGAGCGHYGTAPCTITIAAPQTVKAFFALAGTRALSVTKAGGGSGTVTSKAVGIECGSLCSAQVKAGKEVTLRATPAPGSTFAGFSGPCTGTKACKLAMSEARSVTATFAAPAPPAPSLASLAAKARVRAGVARLRLSCRGASPCQGTLRLSLKGQRIGRASFGLAAGAAETLEVKLSARARRALAKTGALKARASGSGLSARTVALRAASSRG